MKTPETKNRNNKILQAPNIECQLILAAARPMKNAGARELKTLVPQVTDWDLVIKLAKANSMTVHLYHQLHRACWELVPTEVRSYLIQRAQHVEKRNLYLSFELLRCIKSLNSSGIRTLSFKGPLLSILAYGDLAGREFADIDLIVERTDVEAARRGLLALGYSPSFGNINAPPPKNLLEAKAFGAKLFELSFRKHASDKSTSLVVDLHWKTSASHQWPLCLDKLATNIVKMDLLGRPVETISNEALLVTLCIHNLRSGWSELRWATDIAGLIAANPELNWSEVEMIASLASAEKTVALGLELVSTALDIQIPPSARKRFPCSADLKNTAEQIPLLWFGLHALLERTFIRQQLSAKHSTKEKLAFLLCWFIGPDTSDWLRRPLPPSFYWLYYLLRPVHIVGMFITKRTAQLLNSAPKTSSSADNYHQDL